MWGGNYWWKKLFRAKICVPEPLAPTSVLTQNKGPDPISPTPPPSFGGRPCHPPPRDLLERGGEGGRGSRGGGEGVQGGAPPPPRRNVPSPQGTENLLGNEPLSTWKCHLVGRKQSQFIIASQFRVPSSNQDTTNTTKRDIHHLMPTHSDHGQSELDSPELEPPSAVEVELEPDDDEES